MHISYHIERKKYKKNYLRNAYIMCAVQGTNFCSSAKEAFFLLLRLKEIYDHCSEVLLHLERMFDTVRSGQNDQKWPQNLTKLSDHFVPGDGALGIKRPNCTKLPL